VVRLLVPLLVLGAALAAAPQPAPGPDEVLAWAAAMGCPPGELRIERSTPHDFTGDGTPEVVLDASACTSAAAGPALHVVLTRGEDGKLVELPLPKLEAATFAGLVGDRSLTLAVAEGLLVATWTDGTGRAAPLVVRYRFTEGAFAVDSTDKAPTFPTSYDCGRATKDLERGICAVEPLAALDLALSRAFATAVAKAPPARRLVLRDAQRRWLADRDARCGAAEGWVECLDVSYRERLGELGGERP
jgi:uncharacterized protein YecT (DUF1311 family)